MKVFLAHADEGREWAMALSDLLRRRGHEVVDPFRMPTTEDVTTQVSTTIRSVDVVVAILYGVSPNVYVELGFAVGAGIPVLVAAPAGERLPSDTGGVPYIQLSGDPSRDAETIARRLSSLDVAEREEPPRFDSAEAELWSAARNPERLDAMGGQEFERLITALFRERGYTVRSQRATGPDAGYDFTIDIPNRAVSVPVEVKKLARHSLVSVETVRRLLGALSVLGGTPGLLITTSGFTPAAAALAAASSIVPLTLHEVLAAKTTQELLKSSEEGMPPNSDPTLVEPEEAMR